MFTMVFCSKKDEVYTTSEIIAEHAEVQHHAVQQMISTYQQDLKEFGIIAFEMRKLGGRGRPETIYHLNEQQDTLELTDQFFLEQTNRLCVFQIGHK